MWTFYTFYHRKACYHRSWEAERDQLYHYHSFSSRHRHSIMRLLCVQQKTLIDRRVYCYWFWIPVDHRYIKTRPYPSVCSFDRINGFCIGNFHKSWYWSGSQLLEFVWDNINHYILVSSSDSVVVVINPLDQVWSILPASELLPLDLSRPVKGKQLKCRQNGSNLI